MRCTPMHRWDKAYAWYFTNSHTQCLSRSGCDETYVIQNQKLLAMVNRKSATCFYRIVISNGCDPPQQPWVMHVTARKSNRLKFSVSSVRLVRRKGVAKLSAITANYLHTTI